MALEPVRIILILFALFALSRAVLRFKDKAININEFVFWAVVWIGGGIAIAIPGIVGQISRLSGIGRPADLVIYVTVILLFYLTFRSYVAIDKLEQKLTHVVREVAIKKAKKK